MKNSEQNDFFIRKTRPCSQIINSFKCLNRYVLVLDRILKKLDDKIILD